MSNFKIICPTAAELLHTDRWINTHTWRSQFCECAYKDSLGSHSSCIPNMDWELHNDNFSVWGICSSHTRARLAWHHQHIPISPTIFRSISIKLKNKRPTWRHLQFYFTSYVLNMFQTLIYPSSGACDYSVEFTTLVVLFLVRCVLEIRCGWVGATQIPLRPNRTESPTHIGPRTIRPMW
jgi:hypothetical protein